MSFPSSIEALDAPAALVLPTARTARVSADARGRVLDWAAREHGERQERDARIEALAAIVTDSADPIVAVDAGGAISLWNAAAERAFGRTADEAVGQDLFSACLVPASGAEAIAGAIAAGRSLAADVRCRHADGSALQARLTLSPLRGAGGATRGAAAVLQDVRPCAAAAAPRREEAREAGTAGSVERLLESARSLLGMEVAWLGELTGGDMVFRALAGDRSLLGVEPGDRIPRGSCYCGFLVDGRIGNVVADVRAHPELGGLRLTLAAGVGAYVGVPVHLPDGRLFGTLCCASRGAVAGADARDLRVVKVLAALVAGHLDEPAGRGAEAGDHPELGAIRALLAALDARDAYDAGRSARVAATSVAVASAMGLEPAAVEEVEHVALLHDLGKIGIPEAILHKHGPLTAREWARLREHPVICERIVAAVPPLAHLAGCVRAEHERWDGAGYPDGLRGTAIPLASRITLACDAWHAMRSARPHRPALGAWAARSELQRGAGAQFDPAVVAALLGVLAEPRV